MRYVFLYWATTFKNEHADQTKETHRQAEQRRGQGKTNAQLELAVDMKRRQYISNPCTHVCKSIAKTATATTVTAKKKPALTTVLAMDRWQKSSETNKTEDTQEAEKQRFCRLDYQMVALPHSSLNCCYFKCFLPGTSTARVCVCVSDGRRQMK